MAGQRARAAHCHRACGGVVPGRQDHRAGFAALIARDRRQGARGHGLEAPGRAQRFDRERSRARAYHQRLESNRRKPHSSGEANGREPAHVSPQAARAPSRRILAMPFLQELLHKIEVGGGKRYFRIGFAVLAVVVLVGLYNLRAYRNMGTQEAMDASQHAQTMSQGKGYSTLFIRPLSIYLVKKRYRERESVPAVGSFPDLAQLRGMHPDLANPPVYRSEERRVG